MTTLKLNINGDETIFDPTPNDIERAITVLFVEKWSDMGQPLTDESFATLIRDAALQNWIQATRITNYEYRIHLFQNACNYKASVSKSDAISLFCAFKSGENCLQKAVWEEYIRYDGRIPHIPRGEIDEEEEERIEEASCITIGDVADLMMEVELGHPDLADLLNAQPLEPRDSLEGIPTRAESMGWMRVAIGEEALNRLQEYQRDWNMFSTRQRKASRYEWASDMRSLARWARDYELWRTDVQLEAKFIELKMAFRAALPLIRRLGLEEPHAFLNHRA